MQSSPCLRATTLLGRLVSPRLPHASSARLFHALSVRPTCPPISMYTMKSPLFAIGTFRYASSNSNDNTGDSTTATTSNSATTTVTEEMPSSDATVTVTVTVKGEASMDSKPPPAPASDSDNKNDGVDRSHYTIEVEVRMPDMGMGSGKILEWYKKEGDVVKRDEVICDIETPDFTFGMESEDEHDAIMGKILVEAPSGNVADNDVICTMFYPEKSKNKK
jgi:hypothetical protein